jgi:hypothetical protein
MARVMAIKWEGVSLNHEYVLQFSMLYTINWEAQNKQKS